MAKRVVKLVLPVPKRAITMAFAVFLTLVHIAHSTLREATREKEGECVSCQGNKVHQDEDGQASCKTCPPGSKACNYYGVCSISDSGTYCTQYSAGSYEKEGECVSCTGPVQLIPR
jgi:hypothetical protein